MADDFDYMVTLLISMLIFVWCIFGHVILHRIFSSLGIRTAKTITIYILSLAFLIMVIFRFNMPLPLTSIAIYSVMTLVYLLFFLSFYLDAESPSAKLVSLLQKEHKLRYTEILKRFSREELFRRRLDLLRHSGYISVRNHIYRIEPKGMLLVQIFSIYRKVLRWDMGG